MVDNQDISEEYLNGDFDFGFTAADEDELNSLVQLDDQTTPDEIKKVSLPLLLNLKKNKQKDYLYWPGGEREAKCDLQIQKLLNVTRNL
jgi:hypothetical protein